MIGFLKKNKLILVILIIYSGLFVFVPEFGVRAFKNSSYYLIEMVQIIPVIFMLTIFIEAWVPKEVISKHLGEESGAKGTIFALILGSVSAGPIYAAFPVAKTLLKKGASVKSIIIILSAWAVIKVPMLANEAKFLGPEFMVVRWVFTVIAIITMATILSKMLNKDEILSNESIYGDILEIEEAYCIGCGVCANMLPAFFEMKNQKAVVIKIPPKSNVGRIVDVTEKCPVKAIKYN